MQNAYGKTVVAPYSLRAIDGAPVSAPLKWGEITKKLDPLKFNLRTMPDRLAKKGDLFERVFKEKVKLPQVNGKDYQNVLTAYCAPKPAARATRTLASEPTRKYSAQLRSSRSLERISPLAATRNASAS